MTEPLSRTLDLHGLDFGAAVQQMGEAIEALPPGGAVSILAGDRALEDSLRDLCTQEGYAFTDASEPATQRYIVYRQF